MAIPEISLLRIWRCSNFPNAPDMTTGTVEALHDSSINCGLNPLWRPSLSTDVRNISPTPLSIASFIQSSTFLPELSLPDDVYALNIFLSICLASIDRVIFALPKCFTS